MRKINLYITSFLFGVFFINAQNNESLKTQMWQMVEACKGQIEASEDPNWVTKIEDIKNGYLEISGDFPTCGCTCNAKVGAYKGSNRDYTLIKEENWGCSWKYGVFSNKPINKIFPKDVINGSAFFDKNIISEDGKAHFFIKINIPKKGRKTEISIVSIPFGIQVKQDNIITFFHSEKNARYYNTSNLKDFIATKSEKDLLGICKDKNEDSTGGFQNILKILYKEYNLYKQIKHHTIILDWNRKKNCFIISDKAENKEQNLSFKAYVSQLVFYSPMC